MKKIRLIGLMLIVAILLLFTTTPIYGASVESAEEPARKAFEQVYRRQPFTFDCTYCHANGTATNVMMPHANELEYHDKLNPSVSRCFGCHDFMQRDKLKIFSGELVSFDRSPELCYQCHQKRYDTWSLGDHGKPDLTCSDFSCHNPHSPRLFKVSLGEGYPLPPPPHPPEPPRLGEESNGEPYWEAAASLSNMLLIGILLVVLLTIGGAGVAIMSVTTTHPKDRDN